MVSNQVCHGDAEQQKMTALATEPVAAKIVCRRCYKILDAADNFCRHCGTPASSLAGLSNNVQFAGVGQVPGSRQPGWSESPWVVLPMLFLVLGPLALPMLWRSHCFTVLWKCVLTLLVVLLTAFILWRIWAIFSLALAPLQELQKMKGF